MSKRWHMPRKFKPNTNMRVIIWKKIELKFENFFEKFLLQRCQSNDWSGKFCDARVDQTLDSDKIKMFITIGCLGINYRT